MLLRRAATLLASTLAGGCSNGADPGSPELPAAEDKVVVTGESMGGPLAVTVRCATEQAPCLHAATAARDEVFRLDALATDWSPSGEIARLNAAAGQGPMTVSPDVAHMLTGAQAVAAVTGGAFDVTVNALWGVWDFKQGRMADPAELARRLPLVDWHKLHVEGDQAWLDEAGMSVTLGGIAQGYAAHRALALVPHEHEAMVDVSGDIALRGAWRVGVRHPRGGREDLVAAMTVTDAVVVTSGDYENAFVKDGVRYHHILDPRTGWPASGAMSATVVHEDGATCDALATALLVLGADAGPVEALGAWALVVLPDGRMLELGERGTRVAELEVASW